MTIFKFGELFCGPGGLAYGALHAQSNDGEYKLVHEWANDNDFNTCETYKQNISAINGDCNDVRDLSIENLGEIDAFAYGFLVIHLVKLENIKAWIIKNLGNYTGLVLKYYKHISLNFLLRKMFQVFVLQDLT